MRTFSMLLALLQLGRVHFLLGGFVLHGLGVVMALYSGADFSFPALVWGQLAITSTQLMTHYANDYFDLKADLANQTPTNWSGGSRVLVTKRVAAVVALRIALIFAVTAAGANLVLSLWVRPGLLTFVLLTLAQLLAWFYSAPPLRLHSRGLGEVTTAVIVTLLTPLVGYVLQTGEIALLPLLAAAPLCCLQTAMLLSIEFPDAEGDRQVGKRTLVVRLGGQTAAYLYVALIVASYAMLPLLVVGLPPLAAGLPPLVAAFNLIPLPVALMQIGRALRGDWRIPSRWNRFAFYSIVLLMATTTAEFGAFLLLLGFGFR